MAEGEGKEPVRVGWRIPIELKAEIASEAVRDGISQETAAAKLLRFGYAVKTALRHWVRSDASWPESWRAGREESIRYLRKLSLELLEQFRPEKILLLSMFATAQDPQAMRGLVEDDESRKICELWMENWIRAVGDREEEEKADK
ncbi:MAG: hypothetical protein QXQ76_00330 [Candidatus Bathyarchaeia archaeon]